MVSVYRVVEAVDEEMEEKGDREIAPVFVQRLLPLFAQVYSGTLVYSIR